LGFGVWGIEIDLVWKVELERKRKRKGDKHVKLATKQERMHLGLEFI